jgi:hypothetical protein
MANLKESVAESQKSEGKARLSGQRQNRKEVTDILESYLETLENLWDATQVEKAEEYRRLGLLLKYQIALTSPIPIAPSLMAQDKEESNKESVLGRYVKLPPSLEDKLAIYSKKNGCTVYQAALMILSQNIGRYVKKDEEEDDGESEFGI